MKKNYNPQIKKSFDKAIEKEKLKDLKKIFSRNKKLPRGYQLQALTALSFYPELNDVFIEFRFNESDTILKTKPANKTIFLPGEQRKYIIYISKKVNAAKEPVMLKNLNFNMQVAVIGHELGHVADFIRKNSAEVIKDGALYGFKAYRSKIEKRVDRITIKHGLGYQLLEFAQFVNSLINKYPDEKYYTDYNKEYLSPAQIEAKIKSLKLYNKNPKK